MITPSELRMRDTHVVILMVLLPAYMLLSTLLNVVLTGMIAFPIIRMRRQLKKLSSTRPLLQSYTHVLAILIESSLPFTIIGAITTTLAVLVALGIGNTAQYRIPNLYTIIIVSYFGFVLRINHR